MIKVYVVDDEKLVRRGIIGLIDWKQHDMEVIGDTGSSEEALRFLQEQEVDLLFTDLEMPGLSGIPFLEKVREICPRIQIVVLTMHQKFEYIQQALRVGILDYITKEQIEYDNADAFIESIRRRYRDKKRQEIQQEKRVETENLYIWMGTDSSGMQKTKQILKDDAISFEKLDEYLLILPETDSEVWLNSLAEQRKGDRGALLRLLQVQNASYEQLRKTMNTEGRQRLFEDKLPDASLYVYQYPELLQQKIRCDGNEILQGCMEMSFMLSQECYDRNLERIKTTILQAEKRVAAFYHFALYWSEFSGKDISGYFEETNQLLWWYQWKEWFDGVREQVLIRIGGLDEKMTTMEAIHKSMQYIRDHMDENIPLEDLLRLTGMCKSYFSHKFKSVTGKTFVTYLNDLRIETAKRYLADTDQPIYWIAQQVGFTDEGYFRRIFHERTGFSPRRFRENRQKETEKA